MPIASCPVQPAAKANCLIGQASILHKCRWVKSPPRWQNRKARGNECQRGLVSGLVLSPRMWGDINLCQLWELHEALDLQSILRVMEPWSELRIWMVRESCGQLLLLLPSIRSAQREMELNNKFFELCPPLSVKFSFKPRFWIASEFSNARGCLDVAFSFRPVTYSHVQINRCHICLGEKDQRKEHRFFFFHLSGELERGSYRTHASHSGIYGMSARLGL